MDNFNKIISFVLGLVVVIVFFAVVTGKINLKKTPSSLTASPTPTVAPTRLIPTLTNYGSYKTTSKTTTIPATGLPVLFIPSLLAVTAGGALLRRVGRK